MCFMILPISIYGNPILRTECQGYISIGMDHFAKPNDVRALISAKNELKLKSTQIRSLVKLERDSFTGRSQSVLGRRVRQS